VIWLLLGLLLFGGSAAADLSQPHGRALVVRDAIGSIVDDVTRREAAQAIAERLVAASDPTRTAMQEFARRLSELDADPVLREDDYLVAMDTLLDAIDAAERRMLELRIDLRGELTAAQWTALMAKVQSHDD
jgi:hypothetical protein